MKYDALYRIERFILRIMEGVWMAKFDEYFTMKDADVLDYVKAKLSVFNSGADADEEGMADLHCEEIGDGNLNYVFRVVDEKSGKSVIIKQAGPVARISDEFRLSTDRNRIEFFSCRLSLLQG